MTPQVKQFMNRLKSAKNFEVKRQLKKAGIKVSVDTRQLKGDSIYIVNNPEKK